MVRDKTNKYKNKVIMNNNTGNLYSNHNNMN